MTSCKQAFQQFLSTDMDETALRIEAMASEFREIIASISQRCAELSVANAIANQTIAEQAKQIAEMKKHGTQG